MYMSIESMCVYINIDLYPFLFFLVVVKEYEDPRLRMKWSQHDAKSKVSPTTQVAKGMLKFALL